MKIGIIGAGLSGLTAAYYLEQQGHQIEIIEKSDRVGGRVKTDIINGFRLDHGFQVFLTEYPEAKKLLDYDTLNLKSFESGAGILKRNKINYIGDPLRNAKFLFPIIFSNLASISDKRKTFNLKNNLFYTKTEEIFSKPETSTRAYIESRFSKKYIDNFLIPFYGGIFLEKELSTSSKMFEFVFKMFSQGDAAIPALGMEEIPKQIAGKLKNTSFHFNEEVLEIKNKIINTASGKEFQYDRIIISSLELLSDYIQEMPGFNYTANLYFYSDKKHKNEAIIYLNPDGTVVNNVTCISNVSNDYAPKGKHLYSVSVIGDTKFSEKKLIEETRKELAPYFKDIQNWTHLKTFFIPKSLPAKEEIQADIPLEKFLVGDGIYACSDVLYCGSQNYAMKAGRKVAEAIAKGI